MNSILISLILALTMASASATEKPNFIIIFCDDMGYQDLQCYGAPKIKTPNIDQMAADVAKAHPEVVKMLMKQIAWAQLHIGDREKIGKEPRFTKQDTLKN